MSASAIPVPEPSLSAEEMVARAAAMREVLRERQDRCEAEGRLPEDTAKEFFEAGFFRVVQPRRFGGYEFGLETFHRIAIELSRGCPSSGWVFALTAGHPHTFASWPEAAQVDVYGTTGNVCMPLTGLPGGALEEVEGGYLLSGGWDYSSGCDIATHYICSAMLAGKDGSDPSPRFVVVDRADYGIVDNWDVLGLRGSGSRRVVMDKVFVAEHRTMPAPGGGARTLERQGASIYENPFYSGPVSSFLISEVSAVAVGVAYGALDHYEAILRTRKVPFAPSTLRSESHEYQQNFGRAQALVDVAHSALVQAAADYTSWCDRQARGGEPFTEELNRLLVMREQICVDLCWEAVDLLFRTAGTSASRNGDKLQRCFRDLAEARTHVTLNHNRSAENYARLRFGLEAQGAY